ncbi:MAG: hypothetical protein Q8880_13140, partial [Bacteroidota bacterium]|nr:hypothetical protein [Bacteroidota bacterium]
MKKTLTTFATLIRITIISSIILFFGAKSSNAASTYTSIAATNWSLTTTWNTGVVPNSSSMADVVINTNVTVNGSYVVRNLTINAGKTLTLAAGSSLTVYGTFTNNNSSGTWIVSNATSTLDLTATGL